MKIYKIAQAKYCYHVTQTEFTSLGGNIGIGLHVANSIQGAYTFANAHYRKNFYVLTIQANLKNPLEMPDIGAFNCPANFLSSLALGNIITEKEYKQLAIQMGASKKTTMWDYKEYTLKLDKQDVQFVKKYGLSYQEWEPIRTFLKAKGYDSLKYHGGRDVRDTCYVIFYDSQMSIVNKQFFKDIKYMTTNEEFYLKWYVNKN